MSNFNIKRFIKGILILGVLSLVIGIGRGVSDAFHLLNQPRNVYDALSIQVPIGLSNLSNASYQATSGHTSLFRYE